MTAHWQNLIVALIVVYCAVGAVRQLMPRSLQKDLNAWCWQWRARLSYWLERRYSVRLRRLGVWLRPPITLAATCSSGGACNKCGSC